MTESVTVCIVTYNSERCLRRCLEALEAQTRRPADVLVWDNASADQSVALAEKLGRPSCVPRRTSASRGGQRAHRADHDAVRPAAQPGRLPPAPLRRAARTGGRRRSRALEAPPASWCGRLSREDPRPATRRATCSTGTEWRRTAERTSPIRASTTLLARSGSLTSASARSGPTWSSAFCRIEGERVPDAKTLIRLAQVLDGPTLKELLERLVVIAGERRVVPGRRLRVDTTVVETNIHYPTDSTLLADDVRRLPGRCGDCAPR